METAIEAFNNIRENLLKKKISEHGEYVSEYSEDYNSISESDSGRKGILKSRSKYVQENLVIPPEILEKIQLKDGFPGFNTRFQDSGFNSEMNSSTVESVQNVEGGYCSGDLGSGVYGSEQGSNVFGSEQQSGGQSDPPSAAFGSELASNYLENYGLNGPIEDYIPLPPSPLPPVDPPPASVTSINSKKKKQQEAKQATIRQHYYPEGGWGWIILLCSLCVQVLSHGLQLSSGVLILAIVRRWGPDKNASACWVGSLSLCISLLLSPLTVATCRMKSTRLTAVVGGLLVSLGILFTSFASQFHQIFISFGFIVGVGVGFVRDSSTLMVAQYFKRKREFVEMIVVSGSGLGIILISMFMRSAIKEVGWRVGLQSITGVCTVCSILGMFYRSATLYHPQRRAILHLKSQKRKIKDKNKALEEKLPFFDFSALSSRTFQIILLSTSIASLGCFTPVILLVYQIEEEKIDEKMSSQIQTYLGIAWILGVFFFGFLTISSSRDCYIGRQYLCQASLLICGSSVIIFAWMQKDQGFIIFVWVFGIFSGGYHYTLKMFVFQKVRARNFARAWGFIQASQGVPVLLSIPITQYMNTRCICRTGFYFSGFSMLISCLTMFLINMHKHQLRQQRHSKHLKLHNASIKSTSTKLSEEDSFVSPLPGMPNRRNSLAEEEEEEEDFDVVPAMVLLTNQQYIEEQEHNEELSCLSEGIVDIDIQDHMVLGDLCMDNITSCNVVDNYLMLDEYEQNLIKEHEGPPSLHRRIRKWSLVKQKCLVSNPESSGQESGELEGTRTSGTDKISGDAPSWFNLGVKRFQPRIISTIPEDVLEPT